MTMATAATLARELSEKRSALAAEFDSHKTDEGYDIPSDKIGEFRKRNEELNELGKKWEDARSVEEMAGTNRKELDYLESADGMRHSGGKSGIVDRAKGTDGAASLGDLVCKTLTGKDGRFVKEKREHLLKDFDPIEFKTTMTRAAGFAPESLRSGRVQLSAQRPISVIDIVPMLSTTQQAYKYMEETTFTNAAAGLAENDGTGAAESAIAFTERSVTIERIATFLPVTDEQLDDVVGLRSLVDQRLGYMVAAKLDLDLLTGDGSTPNISGFYTQVTQAQAKGADPVFDAIFKGMTKVMFTGFANPTAVVFHPNDWQDVRLTRTTDGIYILGNPGDEVANRLFGINVAVTTAATENTALVGDFAAHSAFVYRQGVVLEYTDSHSDYFRKFLKAIRVSLRGALVVFRASAFCEVTGI
jgi:HK97 family phage major capsid protein